MGVQVETRYRLMVGDLFVKGVSRKGVELTTRDNEGFSVMNDFEDFGKENDYYSHERRIADKIRELSEHGIKDVRIVEYETTTKQAEREVKLVMVGADLKIRHVLDGEVNE